MVAPKGNRFAVKWTDDKLDEIIEDLLDYAKNAESIHLAVWSYDHGVSNSWLFETAKHHPKLHDAIEQAKAMFANKIVNRSFFDQKVNAYFGLKYLPVYDKKYRDWLKEEAEMNKIQPTSFLNEGKVKEIFEKEIKTVEKPIDTIQSETKTDIK